MRNTGALPQGYGSPNPSQTGNALIDAFQAARAPYAQQAIAAAEAEIQRHRFEFEQLKEQHDNDIAQAHLQYLQEQLAQQAKRDAGAQTDREQAAKDRAENQGLTRFSVMSAAGQPNGVSMANLPPDVRGPMVEQGIAAGNANNFANALATSPASSLPPDAGAAIRGDSVPPQGAVMPNGMQGPPMQAQPSMQTVQPGMADSRLMEPAGSSAVPFTEQDFLNQKSPAFQAKIDKQAFDEEIKKGAQKIAQARLAEYEQRGADNAEHQAAMQEYQRTGQANLEAFRKMTTAHQKFMEGIASRNAATGEGRLADAKTRTAILNARASAAQRLDPLLKPYLSLNNQLDKMERDYQGDVDTFAATVIDKDGAIKPPPEVNPFLPSSVAQLKTYQNALGRYTAAKTKLDQLQASDEYQNVKANLPKMLEFQQSVNGKQVTGGGGAVKAKPTATPTAGAVLQKFMQKRGR